MTSSCLLYHGPSARSAVLAEAAQRGKLLHEPFGDEGLKVDEAREFVELLQCPPVGEDLGVVVAGPMDHALPRSADVFLKSIEEPPPFVVPLLWATDLGGVAPTILSRCLPIWCPETSSPVGDEEVEDTAHEIMNAVGAGQFWLVPGLVARVKSTPKLRGREPELVSALAAVMAGQMDNPKTLHLWARLREVALWRNPTQIEIIACLLEDL